MKIKSMLLAAVATFVLVAGPAYAEHHEKGQCEKSGAAQCDTQKDHCCKKECDGNSQCPIVKKFFKKACFFLSKKDELGLSDEQVEKIKALKLDVQKSSIAQEADMKTFMLDTDAKLSASEFDAEGMKAMIDKGMASMADGAKKSVDAYASLKSILTEEQKATAKKIWSEKKDNKDDKKKS